MASVVPENVLGKEVLTVHGVPDARSQPVATPEQEAEHAEILSEVSGDLPARPPIATLWLALIIGMAAGAQYLLAGGRLGGSELGTILTAWALGAKVPSLVHHGDWWRLITANFLHDSWLHLAFNLFALLFLGWLTEAFYGRVRTVVIFVLSAVCGAAASLYLTPRVSLGASTGIMGLFGALVVHHFVNRRLLPERSRQVYPILLTVLFVQLVIDRLFPRTDSAAHIGGLLGGMVLGYLLTGRLAWARWRMPDRVPVRALLLLTVGAVAYGVAGLGTSVPGQRPLLMAARSADVGIQTDLLQGVVERSPHFSELNYQLVSLLRQQGRLDEAARLLQRGPGGTALAIPDPEQRGNPEVVARDCMQAALRAQNQGRYEDALADFQRAGALTSSATERSLAYNGYAWILVEHLRRNYAEAERYAMHASALDPASSAISDTLAWIYYRQGRYEDALKRQLETLRLAERESRGFPGAALSPSVEGELYYHLGAIYEKLGSTDESRRAYARAAEMRRPYPEAEEGLARVSPPPPTVQPAPAAPLGPDLDPAVRRGLL